MFYYINQNGGHISVRSNLIYDRLCLTLIHIGIQKLKTEQEFYTSIILNGVHLVYSLKNVGRVKNDFTRLQNTTPAMSSHLQL